MMKVLLERPLKINKVFIIQKEQTEELWTNYKDLYPQNQTIKCVGFVEMKLI